MSQQGDKKKVAREAEGRRSRRVRPAAERGGAPAATGRQFGVRLAVACVLVLGISIGVATYTERTGPSTEPPPPASAGPVPPAPALPQPDLSQSDPPVRAKIEAMLQAVRRNPQAPAAWGRLAMTLDAHDFATEAAVCYEYAAALDPANHKWPYLLAIVSSKYAVGDAAKWFARAAELAPGYVPGHLRHAEALLESGRNEEAVAAANRALAIDPQHPHAHAVLARAAIGRDDMAAAARHVDMLLARPPVSPGAYLLAADVARRRGDAAAAARQDEAFRRATGGAAKSAPAAFPPTHDPVLAEMQAEKTGRMASRERATRHLAEGNFPAAEREFRQALETGVAPGALSGLAAALAGQRRHAETIVVARQALHQDPSDVRGYGQLAMAQAALGQWHDAITTLQTGLELTARDSGLMRLLAGILATAPDPAVRDGAQAVTLLEEVITRGGPTAAADPTLLDQLAMAYAAAGRFDDAVTTARRAIDIARRQGQNRSIRAMEARHTLYLARKPFVEHRW